MFWLYRYKGFSLTAARTVHTAVVLAGQQGCTRRIPATCCWRWCKRAGHGGGFSAPQAGDSHGPGLCSAAQRRAARGTCTAGTLPPS